MHRTEMSAPLTEVVDRHPPANFLSPEPSSSARLLSLDVFRGLCVAGMILVDNPGNDDAAYWPINMQNGGLSIRRRGGVYSLSGFTTRIEPYA